MRVCVLRFDINWSNWSLWQYFASPRSIAGQVLMKEKYSKEKTFNPHINPLSLLPPLDELGAVLKVKDGTGKYKKQLWPLLAGDCR